MKTKSFTFALTNIINNQNINIMKKVLLFAAALCFMISAQAQIKTNESTENQLKSRVKRVEQLNRGTEVYTQKIDSMIMESTMTSVYFQYDERYNISKVEMSLLMGMFTTTIDFFYDNQDRCIRRIETSYDGSSEKDEISYTSQGWVSEEVHYEYEDGVWEEDYKTTYEYDNNGNVKAATELNYRDGAWENDDRVEYTYQNGKLVGNQEFYWSGSLWIENHKTEYQYDNNGDVVEELYYSKDIDTWTYDDKVIYSYDENHNCVKQVEYNFVWDTQDWEIENEVVYSYDLTVSSSVIAGLKYFDGDFITIHNKLMTVEETDYDEGQPDQTIKSVLYYSAATGLGEYNENQLAIWPNPVSETLNLNAEDLQQVEIFSMDGRQVMHFGNGFESINVNALAKGCYLLKATFVDGSKAMQKFVKE